MLKEKMTQKRLKKNPVLFAVSLLPCLLAGTALLFASGCSDEGASTLPKADMVVAYPATRFLVDKKAQSSTSFAPIGDASSPMEAGMAGSDTYSAARKHEMTGAMQGGMEGQSVDVTPQTATPDTQVSYGQ